jgi:hypothetical protein
VECSEPHAFFAYRDDPIRICSVQLGEVLAMCQRFDLIHGERDRARIRLDALVDQRVDAHSETMVRIILGLAWCQLGDDHQPRDAAWVWTSLDNRCALSEASDHICSCRFIILVHGLDRGKLLEPLAYSGNSS